MSDWRSNLRKYRHVDPEWFKDVYEIRCLSVREIADLIGGEVHTVKRLASRFGLTERDGRKGRIVPSRRSTINIEEARRLYLEAKWPCDRIAKRFGCNTSTILRRLRESNVAIRHHNDTKRGAKARNRIELDVEDVVAAYNEKWGCASEIAKRYGVSNRVVIRILKEAGVPRKDFSDLRNFTGQNSPRWRADLTPSEREQRRDNTAQANWRVKVYARDNYICQCCGDDRGNLNAHHIEPHYRNKALRWDVMNGITLCKSCHQAYHRAYGFKRCNASTLSAFLAPAEQVA